MTKNSQEERLAVLETKMDTVISQQKDTNAKLDQLLPTLATRAELDALRKEWSVLRKRNTLQIWLTGTLSAVFGVVMTILIQGYFN